jgi:hypothetical protein
MIRAVARHPHADMSESLPISFPAEEVVALQGDPSPLPPHPPRPPPPEPFPQALAEMSGHINKVYGIHLFGYRFLTFCARGTKIEVQIAHQNGMRTRRAWAPGLIDIHQRNQVRGGNIAPNDKKLDGAHHKMQRNNVGTPNFHLLHLVRIIAPPKECNPSLSDQCRSQGKD